MLFPLISGTNPRPLVTRHYQAIVFVSQPCTLPSPYSMSVSRFFLISLTQTPEPAFKSQGHGFSSALSVVSCLNHLTAFYFSGLKCLVAETQFSEQCFCTILRFMLLSCSFSVWPPDGSMIHAGRVHWQQYDCNLICLINRWWKLSLAFRAKVCLNTRNM